MRLLIIISLILLSSLLSGQPPQKLRMTAENGFPLTGVSSIGNIDTALYFRHEGYGVFRYDGYNTEAIHLPGAQQYQIQNIRKLGNRYFYMDASYTQWTAEIHKPSERQPNKIKQFWGDFNYGTSNDSFFIFDYDTDRYKYIGTFPEKYLQKDYRKFPFTKNGSNFLGLKGPDSYEIVDYAHDTIFTPRFHPELFRFPDHFIPVIQDSLQNRWKNIIRDGEFQFHVYTASDSIYSFHLNPGKMIIGEVTEDRFQVLAQDSMDTDSKIVMKNNHIYLGTQEGLFYINPYISYYPNGFNGMVSNIYSLSRQGEDIIVAGYGDGFSLVHNNEVHPLSSNEIFTRGSKNVLPGGRYFSKDESWFFTEGKNPITIIKDGKLKEYPTNIDRTSVSKTGYYIDTLSSGQIAFGLHRSGFGIMDSIYQDTFHITSYGEDKGIELVNVLGFAEDRKGRIWMGRPSTGMAVLDRTLGKGRTFPYNTETEGSFGGYCFVYDSLDNMWVGSNKGLYYIPKASEFDIWNDDVFEKAIPVAFPNGERDVVFSMKAYDRFLAVGSGTSLTFIDLEHYYKYGEFGPVLQLIYGLDIDGNGTRQTSIFPDGEYLWVGANEGLLRIHRKALSLDTTFAKLQIKKFLIAGNEYTPEGNIIRIPTDKRNMEIQIGLKSNPSFKRNVFFDYALVSDRNDTILLRTKDNSANISLPYISPGKYTLTIQSYKHGMLHDELRYRIKVPRALTENVLFWAAIITGFFAFTFVYFFLRMTQKKRIARKEKELLEKELLLQTLRTEKEQLKVQSIVSSFNPHFINNSFHWIQSRYRKDPEMVTMVSRLSENIRAVFSLTRNGSATHSLEAEMQLVNNYIEIQKIRFDNSFEFISPDPNILGKFKNIQVIIMQILIHVENAIEHGIRNRRESTYVKLDIRDENDFIEIRIEDDGIGRADAEKMGCMGTQQGTNMLKELHAIFNHETENEAHIESYYIDNFINNEYGTIIVIRIPKGFQYKI